jgi:hypothetical protein
MDREGPFAARSGMADGFRGLAARHP